MITRLPSFHFMVSWFHTLWWHFLLPDTVPPKFKVLDTAAHRLWGCFSLIGSTWFQNSIHFWAATGCSSALSRVFKGPSPASFDFLMDAFLLQTGKLPSSGPLANISCSRPGNIAQVCPKLQPFWLFMPNAELLTGRVQDQVFCCLVCLHCLVHCLALHRHYVNICWVCDCINIRTVVIWMLITREITSMGRASVLLFFFQVSFLSKGLSPRVHLQRTQKGTLDSFEKNSRKCPFASLMSCV